MRHFDTRKDGQVSYNEFCDALLLGIDTWDPSAQGLSLL